MYIPAAFKVDDPLKLAGFIAQYSFGELVTCANGVPFASHLPMLYRPDEGAHGTLLGHMAMANPQWHHFKTEQEVLAIFHGPHGYISPSWYETGPAVPTWNYTAVHAYGLPRIIEENARVVALLNESIAAYESQRPQPWTGDLPADFRDRLVKGIVAFEICVTRIEGKFKLSQNRPSGDVQRVIEALANSRSAEDHALAELMRAESVAS